MYTSSAARESVSSLVQSIDEPLEPRPVPVDVLPAALRSGWHVVDSVLASSAIRSANVRVSTAAGPTNSRSYLSYADGPTGTKVEYVDTSAVVELFAAGATLILDAIDTLLPDVSLLVDELTRALGKKSANAVLFATPSAQRGLPAHADHVDVLVLQVVGSKNWTVWDADGRRVARTLSPEDQEASVSRSFVIEPGQCFFLPAGTPHCAETPPGSGSVHMSVTLTDYSVRDALAKMLDAAANSLEIDLDGPTPKFPAMLSDITVRLLTAATAASLDIAAEKPRPPKVIDYAHIEPGAMLTGQGTIRAARSGDRSRLELVGSRATLVLKKETVESISILNGKTSAAAGELIAGRPVETNLALSLALLRAGVLTTVQERI